MGQEKDGAAAARAQHAGRAAVIAAVIVALIAVPAFASAGLHASIASAKTVQSDVYSDVYGQELEEVELSGKTSYSKSLTSSAFTLNASSTTKGAKLSYKSSKTSVARVSSTGKVTIRGIGTTIITVTATADGYATSTMEVKVKVSVLSAPEISSLTSNRVGQITVTAKKVSGITGYMVYYQVKGMTAKAVKVTGTSLSTTIKRLPQGKRVKVRVRTYKTIGSKTYYSAWSNFRSVTTAKLAKATFKSVKSNKPGQIVVTAKKVSGITGYQVYYKVKGKSAKTVKVAGSSLSTTIKKLSKGKNVTVKVRTYKKAGSKVYYSSWSSAKKVKVKK